MARAETEEEKRQRLESSGYNTQAMLTLDIAVTGEEEARAKIASLRKAAQNPWHWRYRYFGTYLITLATLTVALGFSKLTPEWYAGTVTTLFTILLGGSAAVKRAKAKAAAALSDQAVEPEEPDRGI